MILLVMLIILIIIEPFGMCVLFLFFLCLKSLQVSIHDMQPYGDTIYHKAAIYSIAAYASTFDDWNVPHEQLEMLPVGQNTEIACTYFAAGAFVICFAFCY